MARLDQNSLLELTQQSTTDSVVQPPTPNTVVMQSDPVVVDVGNIGTTSEGDLEVTTTIPESVIVETTYAPPPGDEIPESFEAEQAEEFLIEGEEIVSPPPSPSAGVASLIASKMTEASNMPEKVIKTRKPRDANIEPTEGNSQPRRSTKAVDPNRLYDGTQLHADHHGYFVHRDYASHFFRWGFVSRRIKPGMRVLDVGCGQDLPLARVISAPNVYPNSRPSQVVCVDWNPIDGRSFNPSWLQKHEKFDFCTRYPELVGSFLPDDTYKLIEDQRFDLIINLEVIEHMGIEQGDELLKGIYFCLKPGGQVILSTPVFDGSAAANHIHEYKALELWNKFVAAGFTIVERYGTFASLDVLKPVLPPDYLHLVEMLSKWYGNDVISTFLAPLYPDHSRNNAWVLMRTVDCQVPQ